MREMKIQMSEKVFISIRCCIRARDEGIRYLAKEYDNFKKDLIPKIQEVVRQVVKDNEIKVYGQQKWILDKKLNEYVKNLPLHSMPFHNQSVWIEQTKQGYFRIHFKNKQLSKGQDIICNLVVPKKYRGLVAKASGKDNPMLAQVELIEDKKYGRFNVHIALRLRRPKPYKPKGWIGVDLGWNCLAVSALVAKDKISDVTFHGKNYKTRILQLKYLLKQYARSGRSWKKWNHRLKHIIKYTVGVIAKEIVQKALKHKAGIALEDLTFPSQTKNFLIPRYKLKCAIENLCQRKGIPFKLVDPRNTSITCNRCGYISKASRNGKTFICQNCDYGCDADYNGCVNIAKKAILQ